MDNKSYKILLIEDNEEDVFLFREIIREEKNILFDMHVESTLKGAFSALHKDKFDIVFTNLGLPDSKGLNILIQLIEKYSHLPIIVLTDLNDNEVGVSCIKQGAQDYIVKGEFDIQKIIQTIRYSSNRKKIENEYRESTDRFKSIAENIQDGLTIIENNVIIYLNARMAKITGYSFEEMKLMYEGKSDEENQLKEFFKHLNETGNYYGDESVWIKRKNGRRSYLRIRSVIKKINDNQVVKYIAATDITEQWRSGIVQNFVNMISASKNIVENERHLFKIIYKEIRKIFNDKEICLGILKANQTIDIIQIEKKEINITNFPLKESMCSLLFEDKDAKFYNEKELIDFNTGKDIKYSGQIPKSWMGASLYNNDKKHGILILKDFENNNAFNDDDLELLKFIAKQTTLAIQKNKSEEKIRQLTLSVEQSPVCIIITNVDGIIEYVNNSFTEITDYSKDEVIGKNTNILKSGKTTKKTYEKLWQTIKNGEIWKGILINKKKSGEIYYEEAKISPVFNRENEITHYVAIKEDISERILKEKELLEAKENAEESESKFKNLLVEMQMKNREISALLDGAKKILEISSFEKTAKILFDSCKKLTGAKVGYVSLLSETGEENIVSFLDNVADNGTLDTNLPIHVSSIREQAYRKKETVYHNDFHKSEWEKHMPDGYVIMKNVLFAPLVLKNQAVGLIGLANKNDNFNDADARMVTAFGELASLALFNSKNIEELKGAKEKAEESGQLKSSFLANMSHEVRTPMNGIVGFSQFLKDPDLTHENKLRYINIINESCQQLLRIIEDILEISKLETGQIEIFNEEFDAGEIINLVYDNHKEICKNKGIELEYKNYLSQNKTLFNDKMKVTHMLNNLMNNAIKFTHEGKIELGIKESTNEMEFYVKDTGIGIEFEIQDKIFERFRQAELTMSRTYGGTGLGLAIAKGYADLMNGEIHVDSKPGFGSTFSVKIPHKKSAIKADVSEFIEAYDPIISFNNASVLIAEDEEINYQYLKRVFNEIGVNNILRAYNGKEAIDICEQNQAINLIMMDLKMPIMNGFEATRKIKSTNPKVPIVAQTALAIPGDKQKAMEAGCDDYITKPIDYDSLLALIEKYISW
jgi:PAS domain S-box-containing protein